MAIPFHYQKSFGGLASLMSGIIVRIAGIHLDEYLKACNHPQFHNNNKENI